MYSFNVKFLIKVEYIIQFAIATSLEEKLDKSQWFLNVSKPFQTAKLFLC